MSTLVSELRSGGHRIDTSPDRFGPLLDSTPILRDVPALRDRMAHNGYLFLPGMLNAELVMAARKEVCERMAADGVLDGACPTIEGVLAHGRKPNFRRNKTEDNAPLMRLLYAEDGSLMQFWRSFFGKPVRHFDFTWFREIAPGHGTASHCDIVYMGRGSQNLYTAWTPLGNIDLALGGLMVLEGSNRHARLRETYCRTDVDAYCENRDDKRDAWAKGTGGWLSRDPNQIQRSLGGRWLTGEYRVGDVIVFSTFTVHASLDNTTENRIRLSSDSRYQPADEPADERWIGPNPVGHGQAGKRGKIC